MRRLWQEEQQDKLLAEHQTDAIRQESARIWTELMRTEEVPVNLIDIIKYMLSRNDMTLWSQNGHCSVLALSSLSTHVCAAVTEASCLQNDII
jgi:hypothetical protein